MFQACLGYLKQQEDDNVDNFIKAVQVIEVESEYLLQVSRHDESSVAKKETVTLRWFLHKIQKIKQRKGSNPHTLRFHSCVDIFMITLTTVILP